MTSGGLAGTSGGAARAERRAVFAIVALSLVNNLVNVATISTDRADEGLSDLGWQLWVWELSSWLGFCAMLPFALGAARRFRPPRLPWPAIPLAHLPVSMLFSGGHVAVMLAIRKVAYATAGHGYDFFGDSVGGTLLYEYRKDVLFYGAVVAVLLMARALGEGRHAAPAPTAAKIEVRDGSRTLWLAPEEIDLVAAAGNYVELVTRTQGTLLHRATLASMEVELAPHGFVRVHRSRLVRRAAVREVRSTPSGDFELGLMLGRTVMGSRRYRDRIE